MKLRSELREEMLDLLASKTGINITEDGSIAVTVVDALIDEVMKLHRRLEQIQKQAYLSTSSGAYTQLIANLVDTNKVISESEDEFKLRTSNAVYSHAQGNLIAIQTAIWGVSGVASFDIKRYAQGAGSFAVYVYPQQNANQAAIVNNVRNAISSVVSEGVRFDVIAPQEVAVDITVILQFKDGLTVMQKQDIRNRAKEQMIRYVNRLAKEQTLYTNTIVQNVMSLTTDIVDMSIANISVEGEYVPVNNIFPESDKLFVAGNMTVI